MTSTGVLYFNASVVNDVITLPKTEDDMAIPITFNKTFNSDIVRRQDDYECSVIRMILPSDSIDLINITAANQSEYKVGLAIGTFHSYCLLPQVKEISGGDIPWSYKSQLDVVEAVNRALTHCFNNYALTNYGMITNYPTSATMPNSTQVTLSTPKYLAGIEVSIGGIVITSSLPAFISIYLTTSSKECLLWSGYSTDPEFQYLTDINHPITFSDAAFLPFSRCTDTIGVYKFQPYESLLGISTTNVSTYRVSIVGATGTFKYGLSMGAAIDQPTLPATYMLDSKGLLTLQVQQAYIYRNIRIEMSPKLFRLFTFGSQSRRWIASENMFQIIYPSVLLNHPITDNLLQILTIEQFQATKYRFNHITNILVVARKLDVQGEFYNDYIRDNVVQDFAIDTSSDMENLLYTTDGGLVPIRRYRLNSSMPLTNLAFDILAGYSDGSTRKIYLRPGTAFQLKLGFFPI